MLFLTHAKQIHDSDIIGDAGNHIDLYLCLLRVLNGFLASKCKCREVEAESVAIKAKKKKKKKYTKTTVITNYSTGRRQPHEVINKRAHGQTSSLDYSHNIITCVLLLRYQYFIF